MDQKGWDPPTFLRTHSLKSLLRCLHLLRSKLYWCLYDKVGLSFVHTWDTTDHGRLLTQQNWRRTNISTVWKALRKKTGLCGKKEPLLFFLAQQPATWWWVEDSKRGGLSPSTLLSWLLARSAKSRRKSNISLLRIQGFLPWSPDAGVWPMLLHC